MGVSVLLILVLLDSLNLRYGTACMAFMDALQNTNYTYGGKYAQMGMTDKQIDTQVLAADLERLFSGVLLADPSRIARLLTPLI